MSPNVSKQWLKLLNKNNYTINKFNKLISKENKIIPSFINFTGETIEIPLDIPGMIGLNFEQWAYVYPFQYQSFCPSLMKHEIILEDYATILDDVTHKKIEKEVYIPKYIEEWSKNLMCCCFNKDLLNLNDNINEKKEEKEYKKELMNWWDENIFFYIRGDLFDEDFNLFDYVHYIFGKNGKGYLYTYGCSD